MHGTRIMRGIGQRGGGTRHPVSVSVEGKKLRRSQNRMEEQGSAYGEQLDEDNGVNEQTGVPGARGTSGRTMEE